MVAPLTKTIELPVSGLDAEIREPNAGAERLLFARQMLIHQALPDYWAYLTLRLGEKEKPCRNDILNLLEPDQTFLAIEIYRLGTPDDRIILQGDCPECGKSAGYEVAFEDLDMLPLPDGVEGPDPIFAYTLPRSGHRVEYGYLNGHQMLAELQREDILPVRMDLARIRSVDGEKPRLRDIEEWPLSEIRALREAFHGTRCGYDTRIRLRHECGKEVVMNILTDPQFLWRGIPLETLRSG